MSPVKIQQQLTDFYDERSLEPSETEQVSPQPASDGAEGNYQGSSLRAWAQQALQVGTRTAEGSGVLSGGARTGRRGRASQGRTGRMIEAQEGVLSRRQSVKRSCRAGKSRAEGSETRTVTQPCRGRPRTSRDCVIVLW